MSESNIVLPTLTGGQVAILWLVLVSALVALAYGVVLIRVVLAADPGPKSMTDVADAIELGAMAYLGRQVRTMVWFVAVIFVALFFMYRQVYTGLYLPLGISIAFLMGVAASYGAGYVGMWLAVKGNVRSANAALDQFQGRDGTRVQGGRSLGHVHSRARTARRDHHFSGVPQNAMKVLVGFGFGGSLAALFMRVGGGIYTKAADVGGDLVGKIEAGPARGRPAQPRHDCRQRGRQRRRLRRHGCRRVRVLRGDAGRGDNPGGLRAAGVGLYRGLRPQYAPARSRSS